MFSFGNAAGVMQTRGVSLMLTRDSLQVSELVVKYEREHLTVWGNATNQIVKKCYKEVNKDKIHKLVLMRFISEEALCHSSQCEYHSGQFRK